MRRHPVYFLLIGILLMGCQTRSGPTTAIPTTTNGAPPSAAHTSMSTVLPTPEASSTPEFPSTPSMDYVGGVMESNGWVRYASRTAGISIALPPDWRCINMDTDFYEESLAEARVSLDPVPVSFERVVDAFKVDRSFRLYCFIPDSAAVESLSHTKLMVQEFPQIGYTSALKLIEDRHVADECPYVAETIDGRDAALSECTMKLHLRTTMTFHRRVDLILDGDRSMVLDFMGVDEDLMGLYGKIAETLMFTE